MAEKKQKLEALGKRLRREREQHSLTQNELAELIGVSEMTISRWEKGESKPRLYAQRKLMKTLHLKKDDFVVKEENRNQETPLLPVVPTEPETVLPPVALAGLEAVLPPPPITRIYKGWREGTFVPKPPGQDAPLIFESEDYGVIHVTVNDYPLYCYYIRGDSPSRSPIFDWGRISVKSEQLAISLLSDYFGDGPRGEKDKNTYQAVKYFFQFWVEVVGFLSYERWELSSDQIASWLEREVRRQMRSE